MMYDYPLYRPPSEAKSLILQATLGCSHNRCTFCDMYRSKSFRLRPEEVVIGELKELAAIEPRARRLFIADGDALVLPMDRWRNLLEVAYRELPHLQRVSAYGSPRSIGGKTPGELEELRTRGLQMIYMGVETGDEQLLAEIEKGCGRDELLKAGRKVMDAGMDLSVTLIAGLGGKERWREHAVATGRFLAELSATYTGVLSLVLTPGTPLSDRVAKGTFTPLDGRETLEEVRLMLDSATGAETIFRMNHASNDLLLKGTLPGEREQLLRAIDRTLASGDRISRGPRML